jgi:hypothetical protein
MSREKNRQEVSINSPVFDDMLADLVKTHYGQFLVMRRGEIIDFFDTCRGAIEYGTDQFPDGSFVVGQVIVDPLSDRWVWDDNKEIFVQSEQWRHRSSARMASNATGHSRTGAITN